MKPSLRFGNVKELAIFRTTLSLSEVGGNVGCEARVRTRCKHSSNGTQNTITPAGLPRALA